MDCLREETVSVPCHSGAQSFSVDQTAAIQTAEGVCLVLGVQGDFASSLWISTVLGEWGGLYQ